MSVVARSFGDIETSPGRRRTDGGNHAQLTYTPLARSAVQVRELHDGLLRVTRPDGAVLGYVERMREPQGERFRAKRLRRDAQGFVPLGDFWSLQDAVDCLRF